MKKLITFMSPQTFELTEAEIALIRALYNFADPKKITAVKFIREQYGISLRMAKDICDAVGPSVYPY